MRKAIFFIFLSSLITFDTLAGGVMTNLNQSATYIRMMVRSASTGLDATFYNPAGLSRLENGFHISLNNQFIDQTRTITSSYGILNSVPSTYEGTVKAPFYPNIYAVYKMDKWAFSFGLTPIGGGGSADFTQGVPSFEYGVAALVPGISSALQPLDQQLAAFGIDNQYSNITGYDMNMAFEGSSIYLGYQVNATYSLTEKIGISLGARYVSASNSYTGSLTNIMINSGSVTHPGLSTAGDYMRSVAGDLRFVSSTLPPGHPGIPILDGTADALEVQGSGLDVATADTYVDVTQKGSGITPIIGIHYSPLEILDLSFKYEFNTKIELENEGSDGGTGLFPEGEKVRGDLPAFMSIGAALKPIPRMTIMAGYHWFNDKSAYYGKRDENGDQVNNEDYFDHNGMELALGVEYGITEKIYLSAGYLYSGGGANDKYQTDISYSQKANAIGGGILYKVTDKIGINLAAGYTSYEDYTREQTDPIFGNYSETFDKVNTFFAIGVDFSL